MRPSHSLRSRFAILIALLVAALSWLLGSLIGQDASQRIREEVGRDLSEVSFMMVARLDRDMQSRAAMLQVPGKLRALSQPDDIGEVRGLLDRLQPFKDKVDLHKRNIEALRREISGLR